MEDASGVPDREKPFELGAVSPCTMFIRHGKVISQNGARRRVGKTPGNKPLIMNRKKPRWVLLKDLSGEEWLRLLCTGPPLGIEDVQCLQCRSVSPKTNTCPVCEEGNFFSPDWEKISSRIRRACRRDKSLLGKVKFEHVDFLGPEYREHLGTLLPVFHGPLTWLTEALKHARRPAWRPRDIAGAYYPPEACDERERKRKRAWVKKIRLNPAARLRGEGIRHRRNRKPMD